MAALGQGVPQNSHQRRYLPAAEGRRQYSQRQMYWLRDDAHRTHDRGCASTIETPTALLPLPTCNNTSWRVTCRQRKTQDSSQMLHERFPRGNSATGHRMCPQASALTKTRALTCRSGPQTSSHQRAQKDGRLQRTASGRLETASHSVVDATMSKSQRQRR